MHQIGKAFSSAYCALVAGTTMYATHQSHDTGDMITAIFSTCNLTVSVLLAKIKVNMYVNCNCPITEDHEHNSFAHGTSLLVIPSFLQNKFLPNCLLYIVTALWRFVWVYVDEQTGTGRELRTQNLGMIIYDILNTRVCDATFSLRSTKHVDTAGSQQSVSRPEAAVIRLRFA